MSRPAVKEGKGMGKMPFFLVFPFRFRRTAVM
jgi:hypothetical protein